MADTFKLRLFTPSGLFREEEVPSALIPTTEGEIEVLAGHCAYVGLLGTGVLSAGQTKVVVSDGSVRFEDGVLTVLADDVDTVQRSLPQLEAREQELRARADSAEVTTVEVLLARRDLSRLEALRSIGR